MNTCFFVTSCIDVETDAPLTYSATRSVFSSEERYRQTIMTLNTLRCLNPDAHIYVLEASRNWSSYSDLSRILFTQCTFVPIQQIASAADYEIIRTHPNKSLGEALILRYFFSSYAQELLSYLFYFKMSGRYLLTDTYHQLHLHETLHDRMFFKSPMCFPWNPDWNLHKVDRRQIDGHQELRQYCSVFYGFGRTHLPLFTNLYIGLASLFRHEQMRGYDMETMLYYVMQDYRASIVTMPVTIMGWDAVSGRIMKY